MEPKDENNTSVKVMMMRADGKKVHEIATELGIGVRYVWKIIAKIKEENTRVQAALDPALNIEKVLGENAPSDLPSIVQNLVIAVSKAALVIEADNPARHASALLKLARTLKELPKAVPSNTEGGGDGMTERELMDFRLKIAERLQELAEAELKQDESTAH